MTRDTEDPWSPMLVLVQLILALCLVWLIVTGPWNFPALRLLELPWPNFVVKGTIERAHDESVRAKAFNIFLEIDGKPEKFPNQQRALELAVDPNVPLSVGLSAVEHLAFPDSWLEVAKACGHISPQICVRGINLLLSMGYAWEESIRDVVKQVGDQPTLQAIATQAQAQDFRRMVIDKLDDQELIFRIAQGDEGQIVREAAIARVKGDDRIAALLRARAADPDGTLAMRKADNVCLAIEHLAAPTLFAELATTDPDSEVRRLAVSCIKDQSVLSLVMTNDPVKEVLLEAISNFENEPVLIRLAHDGSNSRIQDAALYRLSVLVQRKTQAELEVLAVRDAEPIVRGLAARWLDSSAILRQIAGTDPAPEVKREAEHRLAFLEAAAHPTSPSRTVGAESRPPYDTLPGTHDPPSNHRVPGW